MIKNRIQLVLQCALAYLHGRPIIRYIDRIDEEQGGADLCTRLCRRHFSLVRSNVESKAFPDHTDALNRYARPEHFLVP
uniref:Uncharacterized protein n=1 Tax=Parascaris equorum TaxID=6256 RepID=A0A914S833_PAREQ